MGWRGCAQPSFCCSSPWLGLMPWCTMCRLTLPTPSANKTTKGHLALLMQLLRQWVCTQWKVCVTFLGQAKWPNYTVLTGRSLPTKTSWTTQQHNAHSPWTLKQTQTQSEYISFTSMLTTTKGLHLTPQQFTHCLYVEFTNLIFDNAQGFLLPVL